MNRKNLTSAVLAGLTGVAGIAATAQAVNINPDGLGQVLIYPYYTVNGSNHTLLSVVNTTENAKAAKVRFTEGRNTREVLDFNLYLSAFDVWTAAVVNREGTPTLEVMDRTCTVPYLADNEGGEQEFLNFALTDTPDGSLDDIARAREGHLEVIEMGTLVDDTEGSATAATHADGEPADCQQLVDAWTVGSTPDENGYWIDDPLVDMEPPSGGLFGGAAIIDVSGGYMVSYDARAVNGFATTVAPNGEPLHAVPGTVFPSLNSGDVTDAFVFMDDGTVLESSGLTRGVDAVSFVFMHDQIMNEYATRGGINAQTEWVLTFPTKHFYVYEPSADPLVPPVVPFTSTWDPETREACEVVVLDGIWNREEATPLDPDLPDLPPIVSPAPPTPPGEAIIPFELCFETSVIAFGGPFEDGASFDETPIFGSSNFHTIDNESLGFENGWVRLNLDDYPNDADENGIIDPAEAALSRTGLGGAGGLEGLPVTGFAAYAFGNFTLGDGNETLANYGGLFNHKGTRRVASS